MYSFNYYLAMDLTSILDLLNNLPFLSKLPIDSMTITGLVLYLTFRLFRYAAEKLESIVKFAYSQWKDAKRKVTTKKIILNNLHLQCCNLQSLISAFEKCIENEECYPFSKIPKEDFATLNRRVFDRYPLSDYESIFPKACYGYQELNCLYDHLELFRQGPLGILSENTTNRVLMWLPHSHIAAPI